MTALVLNPKGKRKRSKGKKRRLSRKGLAAIRRAARRRTRKSRRHARALASGTASRRAVGALLCGPMGRIKRLRRRTCPARKSRGILGGIAGMIASRTGPSIISHNPGTAVAKVTSAFKPSVIMNVAPIAVGVFANRWINSKIQEKYPSLSSGWKAPVVGIATAGALSAAAAMVSSKYASRVLIGGLAQTLVTAVVAFKAKPAVITVAQSAVAAPLKGLGYSYTPDYDEAMEGGLMGLGHDGAEGLDEMSEDMDLDGEMN